MTGLGSRIRYFWENKVHFLELHYSYIALVIFISSGLYYCEPGTNWAYIDALFMATTGSTNTGLNTIAMSAMSTYQLVLLIIDSLITSHVAISIIILCVRKYYFSKRFEDILIYNKAQRMREEHRRKLRQRADDIEMATKRQGSAIAFGEPIRRRMSFMSTRSTPVSGTKQPRFSPSRRGSCDGQECTNNDIYHLITQFRERQQSMRQQGHPAITITQDRHPMHEDYPNLEKQISMPSHPFDSTGASTSSSFDDNKSSRHASMTGDSDALQRVTTPTSLTGTTQFTEAHTVSGTQGIAFAENIKQQREEARRRLEKDRRFEELLQKIADESHTHDADHRFSTDTTSADGDDIMRQPVDKSQLTREQRYRIGGAEYRAIDFLTSLVPTYYFGFMILSAFFVRIYIAASSYAQDVLRTSNPTPSDPWFFSFFLSISAFNNLGLSLLDASMAPFQNAPFPLIISIILILVGNTAFAILLRFIIWCLWKLTPASRSMRRETFRFLLDHPRRCYTTLFPSTQTWWLLIILIAITLVELICFLALNYWLPVLKGITWGSRFLDGLFQSVATRNAGFSVVSLMDLNPGTQLVYIVAMYISVYPVAISMRNSNVYQERALGIFRGDDEDPMRFTEQELSGPAPFIKLRRHPTINSVMTTSKKVLRGPDFFVVTQIQRQLTSDICWVIVGIFLICVLESEAIMSPSPVTIATVIYECVSAFGNVGASTGYPNTVVSQAGQYRTLSKLVLILLMYRGRHRGLPAAIDRAVLLPSEQLEEREAEDSMLRRRNTSFTQGSSMPNVIFYNRSSTL